MNDWWSPLSFLSWSFSDWASEVQRVPPPLRHLSSLGSAWDPCPPHTHQPHPASDLWPSLTLRSCSPLDADNITWQKTLAVLFFFLKRFSLFNFVFFMHILSCLSFAPSHDGCCQCVLLFPSCSSWHFFSRQRSVNLNLTEGWQYKRR